MSKNILMLPEDYGEWLDGLKQRIRGARQRTLLAANAEQIRLYHDIGRDILDRQSRQQWGAKVIDCVAAPKGFKRTEIGVIPEDWKCQRLIDESVLESGHTPSKRNPEYWGGRFPWVSLHDTDGLSERQISVTQKTISQAGLNNSSARMLPAGTVVFSRTATVGKTTTLAIEMSTSQDFANFICGQNLHNHFLVYLFRSMGRTWKSLMAGSIHNTIYMPIFKALKIPLPPLPEQRAIATALSDVDALIAGLDQLIAKKRDLKQAAMQQLLTGQKRLPGFKKDWTTKKLGDVATVVMGQSPSSSFYNSIGVGLPLIQGNADIEMRKTIRRVFTSVVTKKGFAGDILMSVRAPVGEISLATFDVCLGRGVCSLKFPNNFLYHLLIHLEPTWSKHSKGSTFESVNSKDVKALEIWIPKDPQEQIDIAAVLSDIDAELTALKHRRDKTLLLKQGMMQELLTGKTRLV